MPTSAVSTRATCLKARKSTLKHSVNYRNRG